MGTQPGKPPLPPAVPSLPPRMTFTILHTRILNFHRLAGCLGCLTVASFGACPRRSVYSLGSLTEFGLDTTGKDTPDVYYTTPGALGPQPESRYRQVSEQVCMRLRAMSRRLAKS